MNERRSFELRAAEDGTLSGVVIPYGQPTKIGGFREQFAAGAVRFVDVIVNRQHVRASAMARTGGGGLELEDSAEALRATISLPDTTEGRDVLALVRRGVLRGLSAEFRSVRETWDGNLRTIREAILTGIGIVDSGAYAGATVAEIRENAAHVEAASDVAGR